MNLYLMKLLFLISAITTTAFATYALALQEDSKIRWSDSVVETEEDGKGILIIPMEGQMHTDIPADLYEGLTERIIDTKPDLIVIEILSRDRKNNFAYLMGYGERQEFNYINSDDLIDITKVFHITLKDIPQVAWVKDTSGASTVLALSWPTMYMSKDAFLRSTYQLSDFNNIKNEDTHGKIRAFRTFCAESVAIYGKRSQALVISFVDPDLPLSGTWKGKKVEWEESTNGDFLIDQGVDMMPTFTATQATEVAISEGLVASLEDILLAQGIREYHLVGEDITEEIKQHVKDWRDNLKKATDLWADAQQYANWGTEKDVRNQVKALKQLLRILEKNPPVANRMARSISIQRLKQMIEQLENQLRNGNAGGGFGGGGGRGGGGGGGGRPR